MAVNIIINYFETNGSSEENQSNWTGSFARFLKAMFLEITGNEPEITFNSENQTIPQAGLKQANFMICLLSHSFIHNESCLEATRTFKKLNEFEDSEVPQLFSVIKSKVESNELPTEFEGLIPYDLTEGPDNPEIDPFAHNAGDSYWMKIVDLTYDIINAFNQIQAEKTNEKTKPIRKLPTIYLAEVNDEVKVQRNIIKRELQRQGFRVVPNAAFPADPDELTKRIIELLNQSDLAIHLIGNSYGNNIDGLDMSMVEIQYRVAAEQVPETIKANGLQRLIWIDPIQADADETQKSFVENIQRDITALESSEILQIPLEDFKAAMNDVIKREKVHKPQDSGIKTSKKTVYLLYDQVDKSATVPIKKHLIKTGYNIIEPGFDMNPLEMRNTHLDQLRKMDIGIIFQGKSNPNWTKIKLLDLFKASGLGRDKPMLGRAIICGEAARINEEFYKDFDVELLFADKEPPITEQIDEFMKSLSVPI